MKVTFLEATNGLKLSKYIGLTETKSYPFVKNVTSYEESYNKDKKGLDAFATSLQAHAQQGHCLLKGNLKNQLKDESRAGQTDRTANTDLLVLDVDGFEIPGFKVPKKIKAADVEKAAECFIKLLPIEFQDVSYIAQASSSLGIKGNSTSIHIYFFLTIGMTVKGLKLWFKHINLTVPAIKNEVSLSANGQSLTWPLDISVADNSKVIFIATPEFENKKQNPFTKDEERIVVIHKNNPTVDLVPAISNINPEIQFEEETAYKDELREKSGLKKRNAKTKDVAVNNQPHQVLMNPDKLNITVFNDANYPFVHCDINGGDSHAYYFFADNPHYMFNFKGEPIWEIRKADPDFFSTIPDMVGKQKGQFALQPVVLRDFDMDIFYCGLFDPNSEQFDYRFPLTAANRGSIGGFLRTHGYPEPDFVHDAKVSFDPSRKGKRIDFTSTPWEINMFKESPYMLKAKKQKQTLSYQSAHDLKDKCPLIYTLMNHMLGDGDQEFCHFMNWLAWIYQNKRKSGAAWVLTGIQGTGKGLFIHKVLKPLFGTEHVPLKSLENIEEQFNLYLRTALFLAVDEFHMASANSGAMKMADKLKNFITEEKITIRGMRANQVELPNFANYIFLSNRNDPVKIETGDRRFNIAPRQEVPLIVAHPDLLENIEKIEKELNEFASVLNSFEVSNALVRTPMQNEAKENMRIVTMSVFEEFTTNLKAGRISEFADILDINLGNTLQAGEIMTAQKFVKGWLADAYNGVKYSMIPPEHLRTVYNVLTEQTPRVPTRQFQKDLSRQGLTKTRKRPVGASRDANPINGIEITWMFENEAEGQLLIEQYFDAKDLGLLKHG